MAGKDSPESRTICHFTVSDKGDANHRISAKIRLGGMSLEFDTTLDDIREFFTKRRERKSKK